MCSRSTSALTYIDQVTRPDVHPRRLPRFGNAVLSQYADGVAIR